VGRLSTLLVAGVALALAGSVLTTGCAGETPAAVTSSSGGKVSGTIDVAGSDTMVKMAQKWAADFMAPNPDVTISVKGGGSGTGIAAIINGTTTFANSSRDLKDEEKAQAKAKGEDLIATEVAKDGIAVIVNTGNTVSKLTKDQVGKIYRGEITNWKDVGGADKAIVLLSRDNTSGTYEFFKEKVVGKDKEFAKTTKLLPATQAIVDGVKASPDAIGYVGVGYLTPDVKVIVLDGKTPSVETVQSGEYELSRGLFMIGNGQPKDAAKAYLDWILGPKGQAVVKAEGFVPLNK
jgi:phosphate transport system substrate-binding protein